MVIAMLSELLYVSNLGMTIIGALKRHKREFGINFSF